MQNVNHKHITVSKLTYCATSSSVFPTSSPSSPSPAVHPEGVLPERGDVPQPGAGRAAPAAGGQAAAVRGGAGALLRDVRRVHRREGPTAAGPTLLAHLPPQVSAPIIRYPSGSQWFESGGFIGCIFSPYPHLT